MAFWDEWTDGKKLEALSGFLNLTTILALAWVITNIPDEANRAIIFLVLILAATIFWTADSIKRRSIAFDSLDLGKTGNIALKALLTGAGLIFLLNISAQGFSIPSPTLTAIQITQPWALFYIVLIAPYVEERFFRGVVFPSLKGYLRELGAGFRVAPYISVLATSLIFAFFHYLAYGASGDAMTVAFIFSVVAILGNQVSQSIGFGLGMHFLNNLFAYLATTGGTL